VYLADSSTVDYVRDSGVHEAGPPPVVDAGPCQHQDALGHPDCADTLVSNADFNRDITGWAAQAGAVVRWVDFDSQNAKSSGSIAVKNAQQGDFDGTVGVDAAQCIPAIAGRTYNYVTSMYMQKGQPYGQGQLVVFFYDQVSCQGLVDDAYALTDVEGTGKWTTGGGALIIPAAVQSMSVHLHVEKPFREGALEVLFDAVRVTQVAAASNTTP